MLFGLLVAASALSLAAAPAPAQRPSTPQAIVIGTSHVIASKPLGEARTINVVLPAGYANATVTARGLARASDDPFGLPRISVFCGTGMLGFLRKCLTMHEDRWRGA